jgi:DNA-binding response OmpR family regulator
MLTGEKFMNILIVDDEQALVKGLKKSLTKEGYNVFTAYDGKEALELINNEKIDCILLDLMLPEIDGITLCKKIRQTMDVPIIMLTAKDDYVDKIVGLEMGADDYVTKPFHTKELIARIKAILRRVNSMSVVKEEEDVIEVGAVKVCASSRTAYLNGKEIPLTAKEFDILYLLMKERGKVFSREMLYELVWHEVSFDTRTVDVHIRKLRQKIEDDPANPYYLKTKWGVGYYFRKDVI